MSNAKDALIGFLRNGYEKKHGAPPTGKEARAIEREATRAAEARSVNRQKYQG